MGAVVSFFTQVDYMPSDGGLRMLAHALVDVPSIRLFDPKMERFEEVS